MDRQKIEITGMDIRIAIAIGICLLTAKFCPYLQSLSACTAVILCTQDNAKISWKTGITRLIITAVGGIIGILTVLVDNAVQNNYVFILMVSAGIPLILLICKALKVPYISARISCVTFVLVVVVAAGSERISYAVFRLIGTFYGIVISFVIAWLASRLPKRKADSIKKGVVINMENQGQRMQQLHQEIFDAIQRKILDVPYCNASESQKLDIYYPNEKSDKPYPVIIFCHGGAFRNGNKQDESLEPILRGLERGYAVVSVGYRKSGEAHFPAMLYDAKAALRFLRANADSYQLDTDKFAVWGPSSGGWLVSMLGTTIENPAFEDKSMGNAEFSSSVQAVIDWCGPCGNFLSMDEAFLKSGLGTANHSEADSPESMFLGIQITKVPELVRLASPYVYAGKNTPPFYIIHGGADQVVPTEQSVELYQAIKRGNDSNCSELHIVEGKPHHGPNWYHEKWVSDGCLDFLDKIFGR